MIKDKVISISDLRTNATKIINDLPKTGDKYIFIHNQPKAVLVDIDWFETVSKKYNKYGIEFTDIDENEKKALINYSKKKKNGDLEFVDAFNFLDSIK